MSNLRVGVIERIAITFAPTRMNVECSACHLDVDFLSQGSGTPVLYLTRCGHICCDMCRTNWFASGKETCPKCRQPQTRSDLIRIYYDIAQRTQPSAPPTAAMDSKEPGPDLQVSSERFLEVVAGQATDTFCACVTLALQSRLYSSQFDPPATTGRAIFCRQWSPKFCQAISL